MINKINKTNPEIKRRRKVNSGCVVLTSAEYLDSIKEKKKKVADSSYQGESDIENMILDKKKSSGRRIWLYYTEINIED